MHSAGAALGERGVFPPRAESVLLRSSQGLGVALCRTVGACGVRAFVRHLELSVRFSASALNLYHNKG